MLTKQEAMVVLAYRKHKGKRYDACDELGMNWNDFVATLMKISRKITGGRRGGWTTEVREQMMTMEVRV